MTRRVLFARADNAGDVILTGPAVRAVAASGAEVHYLCGPRGEAAARLLPFVASVSVAPLPWIDADPRPVTEDGVARLVGRLVGLSLDEAVISTSSFHQSPLPLALVLRMAGVARIGAISADYPGSLLDVRHQVHDDVHEVTRHLSLVGAMGFALPDGDDGRLRVALPDGEPPLAGDHVVVHPGASVPARAWAPERMAALVAHLAARGTRVVVTGDPTERLLTARVARGVEDAGGGRGGVVDLGGRTDLAGLGRVLAGARAVVVGNTGPAHLAAAVGTPVVSLFAPTVPAVRWAPWGVPHRVLGHQSIACAGCRSRQCPVPGHPCLDVELDEVVAALDELAPPGAGADGAAAVRSVGARGAHLEEVGA